MLTGRHMVRDVSCKSCDAKLGWIYEFATEETQRYKEGRVILERALVTEIESFDDGLPSAAPPPIIDNNNQLRHASPWLYSCVVDVDVCVDDTQTVAMARPMLLRAELALQFA